MVKIYDKKAILWSVGLLIGTMILMRFTAGYGFAIVIPFALTALAKGRAEQLFFWVLAMSALMVGNPNLMPKSQFFYIVQRVLLISLAFLTMLQLFGRRKSPVLTPLLGLLWYVGFMIIPSTVGWAPIVSYLKLFLFTCVFLAYYGMVNRLAIRPELRLDWLRGMVLGIACFFIIGSVLLIPFPGIGMMNTTEIATLNVQISLFQGMANHSQCLGPLIAGLATILYADLLFSVHRMDKLYLLLIACCPIILYKTSSRTAFGAFVCGLAFVTFLFIRARGIQSRWRSRIMGLIMILVVLVGFCTVAVPSVRRGFTQFVLKKVEVERNERISLTEVTQSREGLKKNALYNFRKSPYIGNGFQVSDQMAGRRNRSFLQLLSAPVEKGVWYTAVLEEGGIVGMFIFCVFLVVAVGLMLKRHAYIGAAAFVILWVVNHGEFVFFSMSYTGGILWALVFAGLALDVGRLKETGRLKMLEAQYWADMAARRAAEDGSLSEPVEQYR